MQAKNKERSRQTPVKRILKKAINVPMLTDISVPHIQSEGNTEFIVDGCRGIIEYEQDRITLDADTLVIAFTGDNMELKSYSDIETVISGEIFSVEFRSQRGKGH